MGMEPFNPLKYKVGKASDLIGTDRKIYRTLEVLPGVLSWGTILASIVASYFLPFYAAVFIIAFDIYWFLKTVYLSVHLVHNWKRMKKNTTIDWQKALKNIKYDHIYHMVILPYFKEDFEIIDKCLESIKKSNSKKDSFIIVLASEEKAGENAQKIAQTAFNKYKKYFNKFIITIHPQNIQGELAGKGSNIAYACEEARKIVLDKLKINYQDVIVSAFDIDSIVYKDYFNCVTWNFMTNIDPHKSSYQPVPVYNNNIWQAPMISRVVAFSGTFWQMIQQERPERLATFSSHSVPFSILYKIGYWQKNMVSEDSRIFWNCFMAENGDYSVTPISYPISMDANLAESTFKTLVNIYKQQRRWSWGVENVPYILFGLIKNKKISLGKKIRVAITQLEGFWSLATNPIIIFLLGWLPITIGNENFKNTVLAYNLPIITRDIMLVTMFGLIISAIISISIMGKPPEGQPKTKKVIMILQWILVPISIVIFGAIPALEAQTRLMLGKYMGFWVTPKHR